MAEEIPNNNSPLNSSGGDTSQTEPFLYKTDGEKAFASY
jgi:hypothetical protein